MLTGGVAVIKVGAATEIEMKEKKARNTAFVASLLLTTEVIIAEAPKEEAYHSHGPGPGMGGMGDMGMSSTRVDSVLATTHRCISKTPLEATWAGFALG